MPFLGPGEDYHFYLAWLSDSCLENSAISTEVLVPTTYTNQNNTGNRLNSGTELRIHLSSFHPNQILNTIKNVPNVFTINLLKIVSYSVLFMLAYNDLILVRFNELINILNHPFLISFTVEIKSYETTCLMEALWGPQQCLK